MNRLAKNILGDLLIKEVEQSLREYYTIKKQQKDINHNELECDKIDRGNATRKSKIKYFL